MTKLNFMMNVTFEITAENLQPTLGAIIDSLSHDEKKEIAKEVLTKYIADPYLPELHLAQSEFCAKCRNENKQTYGYDNKKYAKNMTDEEIITEWRYDFNQYMNSRKSAKQIMIESVLAAAVEVFSERANKYVTDNPELNAVFETTMKNITADFPKLIHDTMMFWFASQFQSALTSGAMALQQSNINTAQVQELRNKLLYNQ